MAKRKRLEMPEGAFPADLETKSMAPPVTRARMPIAEVAGEVANRSALEEVVQAMTEAEAEGRVVKKLPVAQILAHHLARDRLVLDADEMEALMASIGERGQQTPIEVVRLGPESYGLISGLRRIEALRRLGRTQVLAFVRRPESSREAYRAMVEENEIRAGLSFYERANIAVAAVNQRVYPDVQAAIRGLFANAPKAKRSKIGTFAVLKEKMGKTFSFPTAIPEHLGLAIVRAVEADASAPARISAALQANPPADPVEERRIIEAALKGQGAPKPKPAELAPGLRFEARAGRAVLSGKAVDEDFLADLKAWAAERLG